MSNIHNPVMLIDQYRALSRIHNTYMLASAWKLVSETLYDLAELGVTDGTIKSQIRNNGVNRARYLVLYDLVNILVSMGQARFSVLAMTTRKSQNFFARPTTS